MNNAEPSLTKVSERLGNIKVLVADRDARTASLVTAVLRAFGFTMMEVATSAEEVLEALERKPYGLVITEWQLASNDGIHLVKTVRRPQSSIAARRDVPIIMLTARSDVDNVRAARDAGITEFLAKPFSAKSLAARLVQVIDNPRLFIDAPGYVGPDRRRRGEPPPGKMEKRGRKKTHDELPPNRELADTIGMRAADLFTEELVQQAQEELQKKEAVFIAWAQDDIHELEAAFALLSANPGSAIARDRLAQAAYAIKSQAGIFGYDLGTQVAGNLVSYLENHWELSADNLTVLRKHIDTMAVIFQQKIKEAGRAIGVELLDSLQKLIVKLG